jgi:uncharacterized membrane-anchored protein YjiN (DUF445 family)
VEGSSAGLGPGRALPAGTGEAELRRGLRRMRVIATSLLVFVLVVYIVAWRWETHGGPGWIRYVRATAEAGAVGALADWFAVTALFKRPLGLRIPHTAIIPERKDALGRSLERFVALNFLAEDVVRDRLAQPALAARVGAWLAEPENAERVVAELADRLAPALAAVSDEAVVDLVEKTALTRLFEARWGPIAGTALDAVVADGMHRRLVDLVVIQSEAWLLANRETVLRMVSDQAPAWSPRFLDGVIAGRVYTEATRFVAEVRADPEHRLRRALDDYLSRFAERLRTDQDTIERVERIKERIRDHPEVHATVTRAWRALRDAVTDALGDPGSALRRRATAELAAAGRALATDAELQRKAARWAGEIGARLVGRYRHDIATVIGSTIERWPPEEASRRIELYVGRDLQFIRINGTVVGSLAGLVIELVTRLLL